MENRMNFFEAMEKARKDGCVVINSKNNILQISTKGVVVDHEGNLPRMEIEDIFAEDWELYDEPETKLKPCPFCGGEAEYVYIGCGAHYVHCQVYKCPAFHIENYKKDKQEAVKAWNDSIKTVNFSSLCAGNH